MMTASPLLYPDVSPKRRNELDQVSLMVACLSSCSDKDKEGQTDVYITLYPCKDESDERLRCGGLRRAYAGGASRKLCPPAATAGTAATAGGGFQRAAPTAVS